MFGYCAVAEYFAVYAMLLLLDALFYIFPALIAYANTGEPVHPLFALVSDRVREATDREL